MFIEGLEALAAAGGSAIVGAMATDAWEFTRSRMASLFGRGDARRTEAIEGQLEEDAGMLERAADTEHARQDLLPTWRRRLADYLTQDPEAAQGLRELVEQVQAKLPTQQQAWMQTNIAREHATQYIVQGGNQYVNPAGTSGPPTSPGGSPGTG